MCFEKNVSSNKEKKKNPKSFKRKRRKFDISGSTPEDAATKAQLAAQKLNAMLHAQGVAATQAVEKEVEINHCRNETRYFLCRGTTHDQIHQETGATIKVRGKYKPPGDTSGERSLHLYVTAPNKESLDAAIKKIEQYIKDDQSKKERVTSGVTFTHKVMVGMEGSDPQFDLINKILGPDNSYIDHIKKTTSAEVVLRGAGSGYKDEKNAYKDLGEPLHIQLNAESKPKLDAAKALCQNLLSHIRQEYYNFVQAKNASNPNYGYPGYYQGYAGYDQYYQGYYGNYPQDYSNYYAYGGTAASVANGTQAALSTQTNQGTPNAPAQPQKPTDEKAFSKTSQPQLEQQTNEKKQQNSPPDTAAKANITVNTTTPSTASKLQASNGHEKSNQNQTPQTQTNTKEDDERAFYAELRKLESNS